MSWKKFKKYLNRPIGLNVLFGSMLYTIIAIVTSIYSESVLLILMWIYVTLVIVFIDMARNKVFV